MIILKELSSAERRLINKDTGISSSAYSHMTIHANTRKLYPVLQPVDNQL
jgi:hypothetical protein